MILNIYRKTVQFAQTYIRVTLLLEIYNSKDHALTMCNGQVGSFVM